jgi:MFS family permease
MPQQTSRPKGALSVRSYRFLFLGTLFSFTAFFMSTIVQSVVAFDLTGTNTAVGSAVFAQGLGMFLVGPVGGAFADRLPKRRVVATGQIFSAFVFAILGGLYAQERLELPLLVVGTFLVGMAFAMLGPARQALAIDLVSHQLRGSAMAFSNVANTLSRVIGPFVAGALLARQAMGPAGAYAVIAALYLGSAAILVFLPRSVVRANVSETHVFEDLSAGLRYVWEHRRLRGYLAFFVAVMLVGFPYVTLMPGLLENVLDRPAREITNLYLASALGALCASVTVARYADSNRAPLIYSVMALGFGLSLFLLAMAPTYDWAIAAMVVLGAASGAFHALNGAVIANVTEPLYMGRVMSLSLLAFAGFGLTALPLGALADGIGERNVLAGMGCGVLVLAVFMVASETRRAARGE